MTPDLMTEFRRLLGDGRSTVTGMLRQNTDDPKLIDGLREYRETFGILDSMTAKEATSPFELIDASRLRRIAQGAGVRDQKVIQVLFSYREFCEQILRAKWEQRRDRA